MKNLLSRIQGPTLLLDELKCKANIERMRDKFNQMNIPLRPHLKTPQSAHIAAFLHKAGLHQATVSSVQMAEYFAQNGWEDLCIAFPYNPLEADKINALASQIRLSIVITDLAHIQHIAEHISSPLALWIKINTGTNRTGLPFEEVGQIQKLVDACHSRKLDLKGFLAHSGHTYGMNGVEEVEMVHKKAIDGLLQLKKAIKSETNLQLSYGDTPACTLSDYFPEVAEVRPGNFMFYDLVMSERQVCRVDDIAVAMACPVVAIHPERNELVLYGGAVHFSKDSMTLADGNQCFGKLSSWTNTGWEGLVEGAYVRKLSQEHGILHLPKNEFEKINIGDVLPILPVHSCLMVDCMSHYYNTAGEKIEKFHYSGFLKE